jgi:hypothetical protein
LRPQSRRATKARALVFEDKAPSLAVWFIIEQESNTGGTVVISISALVFSAAVILTSLY